MGREGYCPYCRTVQPLEGGEEDHHLFRCATCGCPLESRGAGEPPAKPPTVPWIDDDRLLLGLATDALERRGIRILVAQDGAAGIVMATEERPDLILLDVMMPKMTGLEVCRRLRAVPGLKHTPIVLLTALETATLGGKGRQAGATTTLGKPFDPARVVEVVEQLLGRRLARAML